MLLKMKGTFIVLDGPDGSGTTFHAEKLAERLRSDGRDVLLTAEPTKGEVGQLARMLLRRSPTPSGETMQLLFCADRADHLASEILPALRAGKTVVCDRYVPSTIAYGEALGLSVPWLQNLNKNFIHPDATIFTMPPLAVCLERMMRRSEKEAYERTDFQEKVYAAYERLAAGDPSILRADTSGTKEEVTGRLYASITSALSKP
jgi:dTMP kinase